MMVRIVKSISYALFSAAALFSLGLIIWYFKTEPKTSLPDILFWVGAAPIAFFSIGLFGDFFGRGNISYQLSRSVSEQSANERSRQDEADKRSAIHFGLNWIIAGLLVWLISYFL